MSTSLGEMVVNFGANLTALQAGVSQVKTELNQVEESANRASSSAGGGFSGAVSGVTSFINGIGQVAFNLQNIYSVATGMGQKLYETFIAPSASMEQLQVGFETLLGKGKQTQDFLTKMQQFAAATPFTFPEVATSAQHMLAFGFAANQVIPMLTNIGDAMGSMGKKSDSIDHIVQIFGQMHAAGKLNAGDMMQLASEGVPAWKFLADAMGLSVAQVQKLSSQGLIPADKAIQAVSEGMHKMFGGGMQAQATTFNGLLSTLQDNAQSALRAFSGPIFDMAKQGLTVLGNLVSGKQFQDFATTMGTQVAGALQTLGSVFGPVVNDVMIFANNFSMAMGTMGEDGPLYELVTGFQRLGAALVPLIMPIITWAQQNDVLGKSLSVVGDAIVDIVIVVGTAVNLFASLITFFENNQVAADFLAGALVGLAAGIIAMNAGAIVAAVTAIPGLVIGFGAWAVAAGAAAIATLAAAAPFILIGLVVALVVAGIILAVQHWGEIAHWLQGVWGAVSGWFMTTMGALGAWFQGVWGAMGAFFVGLWSGIVSGIQAAWNFIVNIVKQAILGVISPITSMVQLVAGLFVWLYNHNHYFADLVNAIILDWNLLIGATKAAWNSVVSWLTGIWNGIVKIATTVWSAVVNFIVGQWNSIASAAQIIWRLVHAYIQYYVNLAQHYIQVVWNTVVGWLAGIWKTISGDVAAMWKTISGFFSNAWNTYIAGPLGDLWNRFTGWFGKLAGNFGGFGSTLMHSLADGVSNAAGVVGGAIHSAIANALHSMGFYGIPGFASGVHNFQGGWAVVGEKGPELVMLPGGSSVIPQSGANNIPQSAFSGAFSTPAMSALAGGGNSTVHIHNHLYLDGRELSYAMVDHVGTALVDRIRTEGPVGKVA